MSNNELQAELQQITNALQQFEGYSKQLQVEIDTLNNYLVDLQRSKSTISNLKDEKKPDETLISLGSGIMMKAKPLDTKKVLINVGAGVIIEKNINDSIEEIDKRITEVEEQLASRTEQLQSIYNQMGVYERRGQAILQQIQGGGDKPQYDPNLVS